MLAELGGNAEGASLERLSVAVSSSKSTTHRALVSLGRAGFAEFGWRGHYRLGNEFVCIAFAFHEGQPERMRIQPPCESLAHRLGRTVHYAVLDGESVIYQAKVDPPRSARSSSPPR